MQVWARAGLRVERLSRACSFRRPRCHPTALGNRAVPSHLFVPRPQEDLLESIRMLQDQMQLKDMVIEAFIPPEEVQKVRAQQHVLV